MIKRTASEKVLLSLSLLAFISVSPLAILRWYAGETTLAVVDATISAITILFFIYILTSREVKKAKFAFAIFIAISVMTTIIIKGVSQVLWISPTIISLYYLMPIKLARIVTAILIIILLYVVYPQTDVTEFIIILSTTSLTASLSFVILHSYHEKQKKLSFLATIDPLTSSGNRRALDKKMGEAITNQNREAYTMCLILLDLDDFKEINDIHGHAAGDQILITVCKLVEEHTRILDSLYRYGGDEFIIAPLNMSMQTTKQVAEKIRTVIEQHIFIHSIKITVSIGISEYKVNDTPESWISRADSSLYKAKNEGRNKVY